MAAPLLPPRSQKPGRRSRRRAETREKLFRAALALFARHGYNETRVEQITEAADVGKGTFFNYFPSKAHVLTVLGEIQLGNFQAALEDARRGHESTRNVLLHLAGALTREPGRSAALLRSLLAANLTNASVRELLVGVMGRGRLHVAEILTLGQKRGEVRTDRDPLEMARFFQQAMFGMMLLWGLHPPSELRPLLENTFTQYWAAVQAPGE